MCELLIVILLIRELGRKFSSRESQGGFVSGIAFTQNDQTNVVPKKPIKERHKNLEAFFFNDASDHAEHRSAARDIELHLFQQCIPASLFSSKLSPMVGGWNQTIR